MGGFEVSEGFEQNIDAKSVLVSDEDQFAIILFFRLCCLCLGLSNMA